MKNEVQELWKNLVKTYIQIEGVPPTPHDITSCGDDACIEKIEYFVADQNQYVAEESLFKYLNELVEVETKIGKALENTVDLLSWYEHKECNCHVCQALASIKEVFTILNISKEDIKEKIGD